MTGPRPSETDLARLMRSAMAGDAAAYARVLSDVAAIARRVARARLVPAGLPAAEVEDVVQEVLLAFHARRSTWDAARPFRPWLNGILRHKLADALRRHRIAPPREALEDWEDRLPAAEADPPPDRSAASGLIARLPEREQDVLSALALEGLSTRAAAGRLGLSEGAVRVALHRGLARLRRWRGETA